jgi:hypothetical protein
MEKRDWGERGDFRKVTVTLPPVIYDALVQESARRKSAGDPDHLLSAIAREWFAQRQPLLPIEETELKVYRAADSRRPGEWYTFLRLHDLGTQVADNILADLLLDLGRKKWILLEKYSQEEGRYAPFAHWNDTGKFFHEGLNVRLQVTIAGRRRKEALEAKEHQQ